MEEGKSKEETLEERMYQRAIDAYEFQAKKNSTWMNLYALFTGAFFIAYYKLITSSICKNEWNIEFLVLMLGGITSLCWFGAYYSHHSWLRNYVKIIQMHEDNLIEQEFNKSVNKDKYRVYSIGFAEYLKDGFLGGLSGDNISSIFILFVVVGWGILIVGKFSTILSLNFLFPFALIAILIILVTSLRKCKFLKRFGIFSIKSNGIDNMWLISNKKDENKKTHSHYVIESPNNKIVIDNKNP
ncbi:MAG: hypothetical protein LBN20_04235 [Endomicrobium sp.]|jgi:hypothetical protein|nr:hypothetical protein [Endomicrobium sp.]